MNKLQRVSLKIYDKGNVSVIGIYKGRLISIPIRDIAITDTDFAFYIPDLEEQWTIKLKDLEISRIPALVTMILKDIPDEVDCPALFLYDLISEWICYRKGVFIKNNFNLETIKLRHSSIKECWESLDLNRLLSEINV